MKLPIAVILSFSISTSYSQLSISFGANYQVDNFFENESRDGNLEPRVNHYNAYIFQLDFCNKNFRGYSELGFFSFQSPFIEHNHNPEVKPDHIGMDYRDYYFDSQFSYISLKVGGGNWWLMKTSKDFRWTSSLNFFVQLDQLVSESETQHLYQRRYYTFYNNAAWPTTSIDDSEFDGIELQKKVNHLGCEFKTRFHWKSYFLELSSSLAVADKLRQQLIVENDYGFQQNQSSTWSFNSGIKLGWNLPFASIKLYHEN